MYVNKRSVVVLCERELKWQKILNTAVCVHPVTVIGTGQ